MNLHCVVLLLCFHGSSSIRCYYCDASTPLSKKTDRLCRHFDSRKPREHFSIECFNTTSCAKKTTSWTMVNGETVTITERYCAIEVELGVWVPHHGDWIESRVSLEDTCHTVDHEGLKQTRATVCHCKRDLCNRSDTIRLRAFYPLLLYLWRFLNNY